MPTVTHGMTRTPVYTAWQCMKARCYLQTNCSYKHYGGRGIKVCTQWRNSFVVFYKDMCDKPTAKHSLDRIDNDGDYKPSNCRWATVTEQSSNRRTSRYIEYNGCKKTIAEWAHLIGIDRSTLRRRVFIYGWSVEKALTEPTRTRRTARWLI